MHERIPIKSSESNGKLWRTHREVTGGGVGGREGVEGVVPITT